MGKAAGRGRIERRLAHMGMQLDAQRFEHDCANCYIAVDHDVVLPNGLIIRDVQRHCRGRLMFFSLQLSVQYGHSRESVARIDSMHGEVHMHVYKKGGRETRRTSLSTIPIDTGSDFLDHAYSSAFEWLVLEGPGLTQGWT